jgi:hypothetical protein
MGHASVAGTEVYLSATAALLSEASLRFGRHYGDIIKDSQERSHHGN